MNNLPKGWQVKSLGEIAEIVTGGTPSTAIKEYWEGGNIPWLNSGELNQGMITSSSNYITRLGLKNSVAKLMPPDTILIALTGATTGRVGYLTFEACANQSVTGILPSANHYPKFLYYYLQTLRENILKIAWGGAQKHINQKFVKDLKIPLPPLPIQKQIAEILEKADQAKQKRKEANKLTDEFLQSVFIEMFGDPVKNPKGWKNEKLYDIGKLSRGKSKHRPRNAPFLLGGKYPLIQTGEIVNSSVYIKNYSQTYSEEGLKQSKLWPKGTLCISIAANIGFTAILNFDACFPDSVVGFVPDEKVKIEYIHFYFRFIQKQLEENAPQAAQKNINLEILGNLKVPIPPLALQQQFAEIVNKTDALKEKQKQSEQELENLFQSLMQKAFKGELVA